MLLLLHVLNLHEEFYIIYCSSYLHFITRETEISRSKSIHNELQFKKSLYIKILYIAEKLEADLYQKNKNK